MDGVGRAIGQISKGRVVFGVIKIGRGSVRIYMCDGWVNRSVLLTA